MTPAENYREGQLLLQVSCDYGCPHTGCAHEMASLARAQVHAMYTLAAVIANATGQNLEADQ
jgi:hypothetical protein